MPRPLQAGTAPPPPTVVRTAFQALYLSERDTAAVLADPLTLVAFGFGQQPAPWDAPHWLQVPLDIHGTARIEVWRGDTPAERGRCGRIRWSRNEALQFAAIEVDEAGGDIESAAAAAYSELSAFISRSEHQHLLRTWNYLDAITEGAGDNERYRQFCLGRVRGLRGVDDNAMPAATCIGCFDGRRRVQVYWLSARVPGQPLENPRQVSAYAYPRQYGPQSPSFARGMLPSTASGLPLLQSGTAAIVGHRSQHEGQVLLQLEETLANLQSLIDHARQLRPALAATLGPQSLLKVYVRDMADAETVRNRLHRYGITDANMLVLHGEVCRAELLVEIESLHG